MTLRWTYRHKANLIREITSGKVSVEQAMTEYGLSIEELSEWTNRIADDLPLKALFQRSKMVIEV